MKKAIYKKRNVIEPHIFNLIQDIKNLLKKARYNAISAINAEMLNAYLEIGRKIVEGEQKGRKRAEYGRRLLEAISTELIKEFGRGYSVTALKNMRKFYHIYKDKIGQPVTGEFYKLSWTHYCELIENRKVFIGLNDNNTILSPQYDLLRGNAGHPFYSCSGGFI